MAGKVVNSGIVARFMLFQRWIVTRSANRHLPYCKTLVRPVPIVGMQLFGFSIGLRVAVIGLISRVAMAHFC